jgi:eukaryotic-like serine/threonine-protein kinase
MVTGDLEKEMETEDLFRRAYPREVEPFNNLALNNASFLGKFEPALEFGNQAVSLNPHADGAFQAITIAYLGMNRPEEAKAVLERALANNSDHRELHDALYWIYQALGDQASMEKELQWSSEAGPLQWANSAGQSMFTDASLGRLDRARETVHQANDILIRNEFRDGAAQYFSYLAYFDALVGNASQARAEANESTVLSRKRAALPMVAVALALTKDFVKAGKVIGDLKQRYPSDTGVISLWSPMVEALTLSNQKKVSDAIRALEQSRRYEMGMAWGFGFLPVYIRGLVYLHAGQGKEAVAEFQRILERRSLGHGNLPYSLSMLGLARGYVITGDTAKARTSYQDFLKLWRDADSDTPIYKEAKAEYAKLH